MFERKDETKIFYNIWKKNSVLKTQSDVRHTTLRAVNTSVGHTKENI